jgi:transposase
VPACQVSSTHRHSQYRRTLQDLPWGRCALHLTLILQKFRCRNDGCPRRIFAELIPTVAAPRVRRTTAVSALVEALGLRVSGADSASLLRRMGIRVSPNTILRAVRRLPLPTPHAVRIVGVDDWSWRKGQRFGTMLVDLEQQRVAALLPERSADSTAAWLAAHPTITTVTRDRSGIYADGIRQGAPTAVQVADRWHLVKNLSEALERFLLGQRPVLRAAASAIHPEQVTIAHDPSPYGAEPRPPRQEAAETRSLQQHARLVETYGRVQDLRAKGADLADIARMVGISRRTVYRYLHMATPPERKQRLMPPTALAAFIPYLTTRWNEGCHNGMRLWREIQQQGYPHSAAPVLRFIHAQLRRHGPLHAIRS